jgi:hypothetical protein
MRTLPYEKVKTIILEAMVLIFPFNANWNYSLDL